MLVIPDHLPLSETAYYPPRLPLLPPHDFVHPSSLTLARESVVSITTHNGLPDISGYILMREPIDIWQARNPIEIQIFQRISTIEQLVETTRLPRRARLNIAYTFHRRAAQMLSMIQLPEHPAADARQDFWALFGFLYFTDMCVFRDKLRRRYPDLLHGVDWNFVLNQTCTDVNVMLYLWVLSVWHTKNDEAAGLLTIADHLRVLLPLH